MAVTKHDQILEYIEKLPVGERISVRGIARDLQVSEGTAYRAIKEAENTGLVSTIQRVGTIRIEKKVREHIEKLSFGTVVKIIEGEVLAGRKGLEKILDKFVIGAMTTGSMQRYITPGALMIVGNREKVQRLALESGAAVLLTGGFDVSNDILSLADTLEMPIMRTNYDTFSVATLINRAISDQMIKKDIVMVGDIQTPLEETDYLTVRDTVADYFYLVEKTGHTRFPVVNKSNRLIGIVTSKDATGKASTQLLEKVMTKNPRQAKQHMSVASIGHLMIWDGIEIIPVVEDDLTLNGIISRRDVMQTLQMIQKQPVIANTLADQIAAEIVEKGHSERGELPMFSFTVSPQMVNSMGTLAYGVLNQLISHVTHRVMMIKHKSNSIIEQSSLYYFKLIQMDSVIDVKSTVIDFGRRSAKVELDLLLDNVSVAKAIVICQLMEQT